MKKLLLIPIFLVLIAPVQAATLAENQTAYNHIQQERNFLVSIMMNLQTRMNMLVLQASILDGQIKRVEASKNRAFEMRKKDEAEKKAKEVDKQTQDDNNKELEENDS